MPIAATWLALLLAFADLSHFGRTIYPLADPAALSPVPPTVANLLKDPAIQAHQARFIAPDTARVWWAFLHPQAYRQDVVDYPSLWTDTLTPNLMMPYGLRDAFGYEPVARRDTQWVVNVVAHDLRPEAKPPRKQGAAARAGALGVLYVVTERVHPPEAMLPGLTPVLSDPTLAPVTQKGRDPSRTYLSRNTRWQPRARLAGQAAPFLEDTPDRVILAPASGKAGMLVLADTAAPGWQVSVDGKPVPLITVNGFLRAVSLPSPGRHTVTFTYRPVPFLLGLYLSLLTVSGIISAVVFYARQKTGRGLPE